MEIKFTNTDIYSSVDWDKEIANEGEMSKDEHARRIKDSVLVMHQLIDKFNKEIEESGAENIEEHKKANMIRMVEYFYCKFTYHHAMFYRKKEFLDLLKNQDSYNRIEHPVLSLKEKLGETIESTLPLEMIEKLGEALASNIRKSLDKDKPKDGGFDEAKEMFEKEGLVVERPIGLREFGDRDTVCVVHDGIRYHLYLMKSSRISGLRTQEQAKREADDFRSLVDKYHPLVKRIHSQMKSELPGMENLWVMEGGGAQHQAFFGNESGYIATLYLGMKNSDKAIETPTMVFEGYKDEDSWKTYRNFKVDGVTCRAFGDKNPYKEEYF